jgi:hypothetical protein
MTETFTEEIVAVRVPDMAALFALGRNVCERTEEMHALYRLKYQHAAGAVESQFLASLHARISCVATDEDGARHFTVVGLNRSGDPFSFDISERDWNNHRRFVNAFHRHSGPGTVFLPGRVAATRRAIYQLSIEDGLLEGVTP